MLQRLMTITAVVALGGGLAASAALAAPTAESSPTVAGTPAYGSTLTCDNGTWDATNYTFAYQWQYADGDVVISSQPRLRVTAAMLGLGIDCVVTATDSSNTSTAITSAPVTPQAAPATVTIKTAKSVAKTATITITGRIKPTKSLGSGALLVLYLKTSSGLEQVTFNGAQSHPTSKGLFTLTADDQPVGRNTYVLEYNPGNAGYGNQVLVTRKIRVAKP